jgi:hypothetical protein
MSNNLRQLQISRRRGYVEKPLALFDSEKEAVAIATQKKLDNAAQARGFDSMISACTYINSTVPKFASDAKILSDWRDLVWAKVYELESKIETGLIERPRTVKDFIDQLPDSPSFE